MTKADENILDLDALADKPAANKGVVLKHEGSIGEIIELSKKDPAQLTAAQRQQVSEANERLAEAFKPLIASPQFKEAMDVGKRMSQMIESIKPPVIRLPEIPDISRYIAEPPRLSSEVLMPSIIPPASSTEQRKQTDLLERMVQVFEAQNAEKDADLKRMIRPTYDAKKRLLVFSNTIIEIPEDSDQEVVCKALFRAGKPVSKPVQIGDLLEKLGVPLDQIKGNKKVHYAKSALNGRVAKATQINDLLIIDKKRLWFNQKYL